MIRKTFVSILLALLTIAAFGSTSAHADGADGLPYPTDGEGAADNVALIFAVEVITQAGCNVPTADADIFATAAAIADGYLCAEDGSAVPASYYETSAPTFVRPPACVEGRDIFTIPAYSLVVGMPRSSCSFGMSNGWVLTEILPAAYAPMECHYMGGRFELIGSHGSFNLNVCHNVDF